MLKIGIDIEEIKRFKKLPYGKNQKAYRKIFSEKEIAYCVRRGNPYSHFTARFCAKEAFFKASGRIVEPARLEIRNTKKGAPVFYTKGRRIRNISVSLTHTHSYAAAVVIMH